MWEDILKMPVTISSEGKDNFYIRNKFPDADIWLQRRSGEDNAGRPKTEYGTQVQAGNSQTIAGPEDIGIKILNPDINKEHFFDWLYRMWGRGIWKQYAHGTTNLLNITQSSVVRELKKYKPDVLPKDYASAMDSTNKEFLEWIDLSKKLARKFQQNPKLTNKGKKILEFLERI